MTSDVAVVSPDASLMDAAKQMRALDVGVLPVAKGNQVVGVITDRDMTVRAVAEGRDPKQTRVQECMSTEPLYCFEDQDGEDAVRLMEEKQIRRVLVLTRDKQLAGVVSLADIATKLGKERAGSTTEAVSLSGAGAPQHTGPSSAAAGTQRGAAGAGTGWSTGPAKKEIPIARNANPKGVD